MTEKEKEIDRIRCAMQHIKGSLDVDPWACDIAVDAMERQLPQVPKQILEVILHFHCPKCGREVGYRNLRFKKFDMYNNANREICEGCGQVFNLEGLRKEAKQ